MNVYHGILLGALAAWLPHADWDAAYKVFHPGAFKVNGQYYHAKTGADPISVTWPDGTIHYGPGAPGMVTWEAVK